MVGAIFFCLVRSSYENNTINVGTSAVWSWDKSLQASPSAFRTASNKSWAWRPGNKATYSVHTHLLQCGPSTRAIC